MAGQESARPGGAAGSGATGGIAGANGGAGGAPAVAYEGPPMGFNPYNNFWCNTTETQMRAFADAMVAKGLKAAGYTYVNLDGAWQGTRNANGVIQAASTVSQRHQSARRLRARQGAEVRHLHGARHDTCDIQWAARVTRPRT